MDKTTIEEKIVRAEESVKAAYDKLHALETKLKEGKLPKEKDKLLRLELEEVRKLLNSHKEQLAHLKTHNRNSFVLVVALIFICFSVYMLYILIFGLD